MRPSFLISILGGYLFALSAASQTSPMKIVAVEGQGAINIVNKGTERNLTVRVEEKYGVPVQGIPVTFTLPGSGPSGYFKNRARSVTVHTDAGGYAVVRGFRPNKLVGRYAIEARAAAPGGPITASIPQTNAGDGNEDRLTSRKKLIFTIVAAAAAGSGAIMGLAGK